MNERTHAKRIAVLRGGPSSEYDVSMKTGQGVLRALTELGYETKDVIITKGGEWLSHGFVRSPFQAVGDVDSVFIALHGAYGEDGTVQRILDRIAIPYTGSSAYASSVAMNKALTKDYLKKFETGIAMAPHMRINRSNVANLGPLIENIKQLFGPEYVIKPLRGGSSIGTQLVDSGQLYSAIESALQAEEELIVEQRLYGKEATVGVLDWFRDEEHYGLPSIEIVPPATASFFSNEVKYNGQTDEICPGRFSNEEKKLLGAAAKQVHAVLGLRQYSRSDFIVNQDGVYFLEVNTLPGLTSESLFPKAMEAVGASYNELIDHLVRSAKIHR